MNLSSIAARPLALLLLGAAALVGMVWIGSLRVSGGPLPSSGEDRSAEELLLVTAEFTEHGRRVDGAPKATLRGRVFTEQRTPLAGVTAELWGPLVCAKSQTTGARGEFSFSVPPELSARIVLEGPDGWVIEPSSVQFDRAPMQELVFCARNRPVRTGIVRGVVVDEGDGSVVPYLKMSVGTEQVESDAEGRFATKSQHATDILQIGMLGFVYECSVFGEDVPSPLVVPARVGQAVFVDGIEGHQDLMALWGVVSGGRGKNIFALDVRRRADLRCGKPSLLRLPIVADVRAAGELLLVSLTERILGQVALDPAAGRADSPVPVGFQSCCFVSAKVSFSRKLESAELARMAVALYSPSSGESVMAQFAGDVQMFAVLRPEEYRVRAVYGDQVVGEATVIATLGSWEELVVSANLPEGVSGTVQIDAVDQELFPVFGTVTTARNQPTEGMLKLTRVVDGKETLVALRWEKPDAGWVAKMNGEVARGQYRAQLVIDTPFAYTGSSTIAVPSSEELLYVLDDDVPLGSLWFAPWAAETGVMCLAYDLEAVLDNGEYLASAEFLSPSRPGVVGHPENVPFTWCVRARGRRAAWGRYEPESGRGEVVRPRLELGWGSLLYVWGVGNEPLEGVQVSMDGLVQGATDPKGMVFLSGRRPERIELIAQGWELDEGDIQPDGSYNDIRPCMMAYMRRLYKGK